MELDKLQEQYLKFSKCNSCVHNKVCKIKDQNVSICNDFLNSCNYKIYGNIYDMFQPIIEWLKYHYPSGEVKFVIDRYSAQLWQEHKLYIPDKQMSKELEKSMNSLLKKNELMKKNQE